MGERTLRLLADRGVPREDVHLFVTPGQEGAYRSAVDSALYGHLHTGAPGVVGQREVVHHTFPEGAQLVQLDDDLRNVEQLAANGEGLEPVTYLPGIVPSAEQLAAAGARLWGTYPVRNAYFMRQRNRTGLVFLPGWLWGCLNSHEPARMAVHDQKDDYERTLRWWSLDGAVLRLDWVAADTLMYQPGGMQAADRPDRRQANRDAVRYLLQNWPHVVRVKKRTGPVGLEVRLVP